MKRTLAFILTVMLILQALSLTACSTADIFGNGNADMKPPSNDNNKDPSDNAGNSDTADKYSDFELPKEKLEGALSDALTKVGVMMGTFGPDTFPAHNSVNNVYAAVANNSGWNQGFYTGILWHSYELTGESKYKISALAQISSYSKRVNDRLGVETHDMGFLYTPSCVAAYKLTGNSEAKAAALKAADILMGRYHEKGQFIQAWGKVGAANNYRLIVDCLMNIPLLYWASEVTAKDSYRNVAINHFNTTLTYAFRSDGSTYHTYFFDPVTGAPLRGETHQGASDDSTWARGQAWAMYGPLLTYKYEKNDAALTAFCNTANYFLDNLPSDYVPYWDLSFSDGDFQPKDSSAAAIAVCALLEGANHLEHDNPLRAKFTNAAKRIMNSLIDHYTTKNTSSANGLLLHATYNKNSNTGVDEMNIWGDYFYMEALNRMLNENWTPYW